MRWVNKNSKRKNTPRPYSCQCIRALICLMERVLNRLLGMALRRVLQSIKRGSISMLTESLLINWTTLIASISTIRLLRLSSLARVSPSLRAHYSTMKLLVKPKFLEKPIIQSPLWSRMNPPSPAFPGFPKAEPSMLSFAHPSGGFVHAIGIMDLDTGSLIHVPIAKKFAAL